MGELVTKSDLKAALEIQTLRVALLLDSASLALVVALTAFIKLT
ncbi:hypothetical protein [Mesorhizobium sp. ANAO-SY3R2]